MLKKSKGNIQVEKLRAILLLKANLNAIHKMIFNSRVLPTLEKQRKIPIEIIRGWHKQLAYHITLDKKLILDISNQMKIPTITISTDAKNYFNRMAHPFAALTYRYSGLQLEYILVLFSSIQSIRMYLITSFSISISYYAGTYSKLFQGSI